MWWERIILEECPDESCCVEGGDVLLGANDDMARPHVSHAPDDIMNDCHMVTAARPFFPDDIGLLEEDVWLSGATIALRPLTEPERDGRVAFQEGTCIVVMVSSSLADAVGIVEGVKNIPCTTNKSKVQMHRQADATVRRGRLRCESCTAFPPRRIKSIMNIQCLSWACWRFLQLSHPLCSIP